MVSHNPDLVASLRRLQSQMNEALEDFISSASDRSMSCDSLPAKQSAIHATAVELEKLTAFPLLKAFELGFSLTINVAARIAIDLDLFNLVGDETTVEELHQKTSADNALLHRILRTLAAAGWFREVRSQCFASNELSVSVRQAPIRDWIKMNFDANAAVLLQVPAYWAATGYRSSNNDIATPAYRAFGKEYFEHLAENPTKEADFASAMQIQELVPPSAIPKYPFEQHLSRGRKDIDSTVSIVDVGGGEGQWLQAVQQQHPYLSQDQHHLILQDLPGVIEGLKKRSADPLPGVELMSYDFFTPQPVLGARFYHLRGILHDWSDADCIRILKTLRPAFASSSRLLISAWILPEVGCPLFESMNDICMMTLNAMERSEKHYSQLLQMSGFKVVGLVKPLTAYFCILEAAPVEL